MREQTDKTHIGVFPMAVFFARLLALAMFPPHVSNWFHLSWFFIHHVCTWICLRVRVTSSVTFAPWVVILWFCKLYESLFSSPHVYLSGWCNMISVRLLKVKFKSLVKWHLTSKSFRFCFQHLFITYNPTFFIRTLPTVMFCSHSFFFNARWHFSPFILGASYLNCDAFASYSISDHLMA